MNSIAILYSMKKSNAPRIGEGINAELHINYWKIPKESGNYQRFIDFGIMINDVAQDIHSVYFYFPFSFDTDCLEDLGGKLKESELLCTLFNGDYIIRNIPKSPSYYDVTPQNTDRSPFWLYELGKSNFEVEQLSSNKGVLLKIQIKSIPKNSIGIQPKTNESGKSKHNLYFRFRINRLPQGAPFYEEEISNDFFQSAFSKTEMLDFRLNEIRELDKKVYEEIIDSRNFLQFSKIHFFFIGSSEDEKVVGNTDYCDCRLLDSERWKPYLQDINLHDRKCIAYHWTYRSNCNMHLIKCNIFLRTVYKSINKGKICKYCGVIILLSFLASALWTILWECIIN